MVWTGLLVVVVAYQICRGCTEVGMDVVSNQRIVHVTVRKTRWFFQTKSAVNKLKWANTRSLAQKTRKVPADWCFSYFLPYAKNHADCLELEVSHSSL
jgi:hypothetical protein